MHRPAAALVLALCLLPSTLAAQNSRAEVLEQQRAEKATKLEPYKPGKLETLVLRAEEGRLRRLITPHNGFFVSYGYTYKQVGSGIGFGGGFRHDLFDRQARIVLEAGASFRNYQLVRGDFSLPRLAKGHLELGVEGHYQRHPQEDYYGPGPESIEDDRVSFLYKGVNLNGRAVVMPRPWLNVGTRIGSLAPSIGSGSDSRYPSIEERFSDTQAPGLQQQPDFTFGELFAEVDYRDEPGNARQGGHYVVSLKRFSDADLDSYSFNSMDVLLQQFVPIFDKKRVFAFQFGLVGTNADTGHEVPFYLQPTLGGSRTLRSAGDWRFRDTHAMWLNAEYRWEAFSLLDMALFTDWGDVASSASDLGFGKHAYGIGFRFNTAKAVFFRLDIGAGGDEGVHFFFKWSKAF